MNHQPYENWILDPVTLSVEERRALHQHLEQCPQCQRLGRRWQAVSYELRARTMAAPAPGFTRRWQAGLEERRLREQRRQAWKVFFILLSGALFILLLLAGYMLVTTTPTEWLEGLIRTFSSSQTVVDLVLLAIQSWLSTTPLALNIAIWIYLTITLCVLLLAWVLIFWRTKTAGVTHS